MIFHEHNFCNLLLKPFANEPSSDAISLHGEQLNGIFINNTTFNYMTVHVRIKNRAFCFQGKAVFIIFLGLH